MTDLTKITTPFGLLDKKTQEALKSHGGPYIMYVYEGNWSDVTNPLWTNSVTYRVKPQPKTEHIEKKAYLTEDGSILVGVLPLITDTTVIIKYKTIDDVIDPKSYTVE